MQVRPHLLAVLAELDAIEPQDAHLNRRLLLNSLHHVNEGFIVSLLCACLPPRFFLTCWLSWTLWSHGRGCCHWCR